MTHLTPLPSIIQTAMPPHFKPPLPPFPSPTHLPLFPVRLPLSNPNPSGLQIYKTNGICLNLTQEPDNRRGGPLPSAALPA